MAFLATALDDPNAAPCGRCAPETGGFRWTEVDHEERKIAAAFLGSGAAARKGASARAKPRVARRKAPPKPTTRRVRRSRPKAA